MTRVVKSTVELIELAGEYLESSEKVFGDLLTEETPHFYLAKAGVIALVAIAQELKRAQDWQEAKDTEAMNAGGSGRYRDWDPIENELPFE